MYRDAGEHAEGGAQVDTAADGSGGSGGGSVF